MQKNWLIRTRHNQILGPVSKEKIVEFVSKGSLVGEDEISTGNGYWFCIKEKDLLEKYLYGDVPQEFNPISEAPNILTVSESKDNTSSYTPNTKPSASLEVPEVETFEKLGDEGEMLPSSDDLEYPDMDGDSEFNDVTQVGSLPNLEMLKAASLPEKKPQAVVEDSSNEDDPSDEEALLPQDDDLEYPDIDMEVKAPQMPELVKEEKVEEEEDLEFKVDLSASEEVETVEESPFAEDKEIDESFLDSGSDVKFADESTMVNNIYEQARATKARVKKVKKKSTKHRNDGILFFVLSVIIFSILFGIYYYYAKVLKKTLVSVDVPSIFIASAHAQSINQVDSIVKKKVLYLKTF